MCKIAYLNILCIATLLSCRSSVSEKNEVVAVIDYQDKKTISIDNIHVDNQFDGARLNGFSQLNDSTFQVLITPENEPINKSAWYSFKIWSDIDREVILNIDYPGYAHRYVPKMSKDRKSWTKILNKETNSNQFKIELSSDPIWISGQEIISSKDIEEWIDTQKKMAYVDHQVIGKSTLGRPMHLMKIKEEQAQNKMLIIGRQHPPEIPGGTLSLFAFVEEVLNDSPLSKSFRENVEILVFPNLNPDGVDLGHWRHNANGKDLNRDWQDFEEKETQLVRDHISQYAAEDWVYGIDFHTSFSGPYLLVMDSLSARPSLLTQNWISKIKEQSTEELDIRPRSQDLPYCYNWMITQLGMEAVTYEEGDEINRVIVKERAEEYAQLLMTVILESLEN